MGAELLIALAEPFRKASRAELAPENYPYIKTENLRRLLGCGDETLRRRVLRCRREIGRLAIATGETAPSIQAVIENHPWHGYRLNPDSVRIVAMTELC